MAGIFLSFVVIMKSLTVTIFSFQDGHLIAVMVTQGTDAGRIVRAVRFVFPGLQSIAEALATKQKFVDGIGLIAIGNDGLITAIPDGIVDDQGGSKTLDSS